MGFADYARSILRTNERLRERTHLRYKSSTEGLKNNEKEQTPKTLSPLEQKQLDKLLAAAEKKQQQQVRIVYLVFLGLCIVVLSLLWYFT